MYVQCLFGEMIKVYCLLAHSECFYERGFTVTPLKKRKHMCYPLSVYLIYKMVSQGLILISYPILVCRK